MSRHVFEVDDETGIVRHVPQTPAHESEPTPLEKLYIAFTALFWGVFMLVFGIGCLIVIIKIFF